MHKLITSLLLTLCLLAVPAHADKAVQADLTPEDMAQITTIQQYLNSITTLKAGFTQLAPGGASTGTFYLYRPGRLRFDYLTPQKDIIVADRKLIWYYDAKAGQANHAPISRTLADFLLRRDVELTGGDVTVTSFRHGDASAEITLTQTDNPGEGTLTLLLSENPWAITQWRVVDAQGRTTTVTLDHQQAGIPLDPALFVWHDPN